MPKLGSIVKYPGGKSHAADQLLNCRPEYFNEYRDVFCGGSPFLFHTQVLPLSMPRWINDKDKPLINMFLQIRDDDSFIPHFLALKRKIIGHADKTLAAFEAAKEDYRTNGVSYLLLRRFALNQVVRESRPNIASVAYEYLADPAMLRRFTPKRMNAWREVLRNVKITCGDFSAVLDAPVKRGRVVFLFLDPPYWSNMFKQRGSEIYEHVFDMNDHTRLRDKLAELDPKTKPFLLTLCASEMSHALYGIDGRFFVYDRNVPYGMSDNGNRRTVKELVITNYGI